VGVGVDADVSVDVVGLVVGGSDVCADGHVDASVVRTSVAGWSD